MGAVETVKVETLGIHHLGLTVNRLAERRHFYGNFGLAGGASCAGIPRMFVSGSRVMVTLWQATEPESAQPLEHKSSVGLHHAALRVDRRGALDARVQTAGAHIEFPPEPLGDGPVMHMMCREPSGIRVEFIWVPE